MRSITYHNHSFCAQLYLHVLSAKQTNIHSTSVIDNNHQKKISKHFFSAIFNRIVGIDY